MSADGTPAEQELDEVDVLLDNVTAAWRDSGQHVNHHLELRRWLQREWPALADAVKAIKNYQYPPAEKDTHA